MLFFSRNNLEYFLRSKSASIFLYTPLFSMMHLLLPTTLLQEPNLSPVFLPGEPQGLRSLWAAIYGVTQRHYWSDLAAAAAISWEVFMWLGWKDWRMSSPFRLPSKNTTADVLQLFTLFTLLEAAKSEIKVLPISMFGESLLFVSWVSFLMADTWGSSVGFLL